MKKLGANNIFNSDNTRISDGSLCVCTKEDETCKARNCPHKGAHKYFRDCREKVCMHDESQKLVSCKEVKGND